MKFDVKADIAVSKQFHVRAEFHCESKSLAVLGPSGSGKSTLLAGMLGALPGCTLVLDGEDLSRVPMHRRKLAYVPQDALLFPHMTVSENIGYGGAGAGGITDAAHALSIGHLLERYPRNLSGGERKRVALARAVAGKPRAIFLDEPFSGLDETRKRDAMSLLQALVSRYDIPMVLVSHIAGEAIGLTEYAVVLHEGQLTDQGPTARMLFGGSDLHIDNFLTGDVVAPRQVAVDGETLHAMLPDVAQGRIRLSCPANDILLARERPSGISALNIWETIVTKVEWIGEDALVYVEKPALRALVTKRAIEEIGVEVGKPVCVIVKANSLVFLGAA